MVSCMLLHLGFPFICRPLGRSALYFLFTLFYHIISLLLSPSPCGPILATAASSKPLRARRYSRTVRCNSLDPAARGKRMMPPLPVNHGQRLCPRRLAQPLPFPPGFCAARARRAWARAFPSPPRAAGAHSAHKAWAGTFGPRPCFGFAGPLGPQNAAAPRRNPGASTNAKKATQKPGLTACPATSRPPLGEANFYADSIVFSGEFPYSRR